MHNKQLQPATAAHDELKDNQHMQKRKLYETA